MTGTKHLLDYWSVLLRRRWIVALAAVSVTLVALIGSLLGTPMYRSTATLQIERLNPDIHTFRDLSQVDYSWVAYSDFYQTQYTVLGSEIVAQKAVTRLGLDSHPRFVEPAHDTPSLLTRLRGLLPRRRPPAVPRDPTEIAAAVVLGGLEVAPLRNSHLVRVSWVAPDPGLAADVANAVADAYIQFNIEAQFSVTEQAGDFLINQIGRLTRDIDEAERSLQEYGEAKRIVSIDEVHNTTLQGLQSIASRRTAAQTELAESEASWRAVEHAAPDALPEVLESELLSRLRQEYAQYEAEFSEQSKLFKADWPGLQTLASKLDQARQRLELESERIATQVRASVHARYEKALQEVRNLERLLDDQERAAQRLKRDAVEYENLQAIVAKKRETLNGLIRRQNEMELSTELRELQTTSTNARVMERAKPAAAPFRPRTGLSVLLGMLVGLALGVGAAFALDYLDNTVAAPAAIEALLGLPVLAAIPHHGALMTSRARAAARHAAAAAGTFDLLPFVDGRARASEAYRELRTAILLSHAGEPPREIMLTSSLPEEGKSATVLNLAVVLAQLGRRVLVVDTDLRRPRLHHALAVSNARGVSTYLSGLEPDPTRLTLPSRVEGLYLLPSGPIPPNPSELLNSERFAEMGDRLLCAGFDHLIYDSPPVLSVSDPLLVANVVDLTILVVRASHTPRQAARETLAKLQQAGIRLTGVVLNDVQPEHAGGLYRAGYYSGQYYSAVPEEAPAPSSAPRASGAGG